MKVGQYLRAQREERGEDVAQVSDMLRIHHSYLRAIEDSDIGKLPGPTYAVGFVRAYAKYLSLDSVEVVERFKEEAKVQASRTLLVPPSPLPEGRIPNPAILLIAIVFLLAAYGGWLFMSSPNHESADIDLSLPERLAPLVSGETLKLTAPGGEVTSITSPETSSSNIEENASIPEQTLNPKPIVAAPKEAAVASSPAYSMSMPRKLLAERQSIERDDRKGVYGDSRVVIRASEDSWVEVRKGNGELLLTRVLREGEKYHVPNRSGLTLVTGNAGALKFFVDGEIVGDIGPLGTVRRNVLLDPQAIKDGTAYTP